MCVAALLQIIIKNEFNRDINQQIIADFFGINLPIDQKDNSNLVTSNMEYVEDDNKLGIIIKDNSINQFFQEYKIPMIEDYLPIYEIDDMVYETQLNQLASEDVYVICGYDYDFLHHREATGVGHVSIITDYNPQTNIVTIYDPGPKNPGYKSVIDYDLYRSIKIKKDGFWIIKRKK
ncbi:hypothetical protein QNH46_01430 [Paenibacillus woosongensis]|uniref:Peptidase C39-like domain-containing protein n=1 Tax=Paenibacillus woosongensis TaxID=307580 RepID=A0A7X2Z3R3_9BACL|nr:hypothetical protein [Paenibacillus woosongensis]MUG46972.1 hypothetical protein [Paenibacillus woosongensis]WHX49382.1 hypothetical protein QNH46_01430 [Paenibacillus woosongensis]